MNKFMVFVLAAGLFMTNSPVHAATAADLALLDEITARLAALQAELDTRTEGATTDTVVATTATPKVAATQTVANEIEATPTAHTGLTVTTEWSGTFTFENVRDVKAAQTECEAIAYNTDYMWQDIVCTYEGEVIYDDVFIAG